MTSLMSMLLARPFRVVDLTMPLNPATPSPVEPGVEQRVLRRHGDPAPEGAPQYKMTWFGMNDHCGTHMDAPSHFIPDGPGIDRADIEAFCLMPAIRLDLAPGSLFQRIDASDILAALDAMNARLKAKGEESLGMPPKQSLILLHTGHDRHVGFPEYGQAPFLTPRACRLLKELDARAVGDNGPTVDDRRDAERPAHTLLLSQGVAIIEGVVKTGDLPDGLFLASALPLKLTGATGSPVRLVALIA